MAEIKYNNLYNELNPMERRFYDQQFKKSYNPNQENIMLSSQPAYEQMKAVYDAQQQIPEKSLFDSLNLFSSASAAEKPPVPNLSLGYNMPTFDLGTGITNTTAATPFKIGLSDILTQYNVPGLRSQNLQDDLAQQIVEENRQKVASDFVNVPQDYYPSIPGGINQTTPIQNLGINTSYGVANTPDVIGDFLGSDVYQTDDGRAYYIDSKGEKILAPQKANYYKQKQKPSGLATLKNLMPGSLFGNLLSGIFGKDSPEVRATKDFYARNYGVNSAGSVASGIMEGYNPVSGGFLNMITGGKYGEPMQVGLANTARRRIENILNRKAPQTEASRAKIQELQKFAEADTINRARTRASDVYSRAEANKALGPGGGFSTSGSKRDSGFTSRSSSPSGRGRQDY